MNKKLILGMVFLIVSVFTLSSFVSKKENTKSNLLESNQTKTYYVYGYAWGNGNNGGLYENGSDGVAYISNISSLRASSHYSGKNLVRSSAKVQFMETAESRYSKKIYNTYWTSGVMGVEVFDSYDKAVSERRKTIAKYRREDAKVRYMNNFKLYKD
jgi:hypothetical protein